MVGRLSLLFPLFPIVPVTGVTSSVMVSAPRVAGAAVSTVMVKFGERTPVLPAWSVTVVDST